MIYVWRVDLLTGRFPSPTAAESARAARLATPELARRYLAAHGALRAILERFAGDQLTFAMGEKGKPYLAHAPEVKFNLSRSHERALIAVSRDTEVGVDIEYMRTIVNYAEVAEHFFPPGEPAPGDEADFFRRWTRIEAFLKARGVGLYGMGEPFSEGWMVEDIDAGPGYAAAVAWSGASLPVRTLDFGADE